MKEVVQQPQRWAETDQQVLHTKACNTRPLIHACAAKGELLTLAIFSSF